MRATLTRTALASAIALASSQAALANDNTLQLDQMVVSAAGFEQKITDAPASISVITGEELKKKRVSNIAEALNDAEGVDVSGNAGKTGGLNVSIRGMGDAYTLVLVDGKRQNPAGNVTPNGFGETRFSFLPPVSAIERIEVIRGPMSTLYGSDAMGGVINIITKKVGSEWAGSASVDTTLQEQREYGDTRSTQLYLSGPLVADTLGLQLRGKYQERDSSAISYQDVTGSDISPSMGWNPVESDLYTAGGRLTFTPNADHDLSLDLDQSKQRYDNSKGQLGTLGASGGYERDQRYNREQYQLAHTGRFAFGTLDSSYTRNETETLGRLIPNGTPNRVAGDKRTLDAQNDIFDLKLVSALGSHNLSVGGQWWKAQMTEGLIDDQLEHKMVGLFIEDEWRLRDDLALTLGLRRDDHSEFGGQTSPRAYLVWNTTENWTLKGGVSEGFKAPDLQQLVGGINGFGGQGTIPLLGNPDLQPETSTSSEFGVYFDNLDDFNGNVTLFHNKFKDKIGSEVVVNCEYQNVAGCITVPGGPWLNRGRPGRNQTFSKPINVDEAIAKGVEVAGRYHFTAQWNLAANYTYTKTEQEGGPNDGWPLNDTPKHQLNATLNWQTSDRLSTWLKGEYRSERFRRTSPAINYAYNAFGDYKAYTLFHLGGSYQASENLSLSATVYNLFDKDFVSYERYASNAAGTTFEYGNEYNNNQERRRLWLSATYDF